MNHPTSSSMTLQREQLLVWCREQCQHKTGLFPLFGQGRALFFFDFTHQWMQSLSEREMPDELVVCQERFGVERNHPQSQHLARWIWDTARHEQWAQTIPWKEHDIVALHGWPPFQVLSHRHDHFLLASYLMRHPSSMLEASRVLRLPLEDAMAFLRGVYGMGLAERTQSIPKPTSPTSRLMKWWQGRRQEIKPQPSSPPHSKHHTSESISIREAHLAYMGGHHE